MYILQLLLTFLGAPFKSQHQLALENLALRQQLAMLRQSVKRPRAKHLDKLCWIFFSRHVDGWRSLHRRDHQRIPITAAKSLCRTRDRMHPPGMPGSYSSCQRAAFATNSS